MLHDRKRKRSLQCVAVAPSRRRASDADAAPDAPSVRPPHRAASTAQVRAALATSHFLAVSPRFTDASIVAWCERRGVAAPAEPAAASTALVEAPLATTAASDAHVHAVRKVVGHAHRARRILMDRLTMVNLRRMHRCELVDEVERLKKVLAGLQEQIDTTVRNVETMDRLVQHLQNISNISTEATAASNSAVGSAAASDADVGAAEHKDEAKRVELLEAAKDAETAPPDDEQEPEEKKDTTQETTADAKSDAATCNEDACASAAREETKEADEKTQLTAESAKENNAAGDGETAA